MSTPKLIHSHTMPSLSAFASTTNTLKNLIVAPLEYTRNTRKLYFSLRAPPLLDKTQFNKVNSMVEAVSGVFHRSEVQASDDNIVDSELSGIREMLNGL